MKEYEIVAKFYNACAGASRPETAEGQILFCYDNGSVCYSYEFTEI